MLPSSLLQQTWAAVSLLLKGKKMKFLTVEIPIAYQCKQEGKLSPSQTPMCAAYLNSSWLHQRRLREWCWLLTHPQPGFTCHPPWDHQHPSGLGTFTASTVAMLVSRWWSKMLLDWVETLPWRDLFPPPPPRVQKDSRGCHSPFRGWLGHSPLSPSVMGTAGEK